MYKKYIHPCYSWNDFVLLQLDDKTFVDTQGKIYSIREINDKLSEDKKKVESGDYGVNRNIYGLVDIQEAEFKESVYEVLSAKKQEIISREIDVKKIQSLTGVYL